MIKASFAGRISQRVIAAAAGVLLISASVRADTYSFLTLDNNADPTFNQLLSINSANTIAGYFGSGATGHPNQGYTLAPPYSQASYTNENFPGSVQTQVTGINTAGVTVGFWVDATGANFGFVKNGGVFTSVSNPLVSSTPNVNQLLGLNDTGKAAGFYADSAGNDHGYLYTIASQVFTPINPPGAVTSQATGVNNAGEVSGFYTNGAGNTFGYLLNGSTFTSLEFPGSTNTVFLGLNNAGQVVGSYVDAGNLMHGLVYNSITQTWLSLDDPNGIGTTTINGINDQGLIVGFYVNGNNTHGLLGLPNVPEPSSLSLSLMALLGIRLFRAVKARESLMVS
jgi:hypothetical protein